MGTTYIEEMFGYNLYDVHPYTFHFIYPHSSYLRISATPRGGEKIIDTMIAKIILRDISMPKSRNPQFYTARSSIPTKSRPS